MTTADSTGAAFIVGNLIDQLSATVVVTMWIADRFHCVV
jgi:hypothetical protein